jgi:hypothetical protein
VPLARRGTARRVRALEGDEPADRARVLARAVDELDDRALAAERARDVHHDPIARADAVAARRDPIDLEVSPPEHAER